MILKPTYHYPGMVFLMTVEYFQSIVVGFVFPVSPLYNSNIPTDSSAGAAGLPWFQNSIFFYFNSLL